MTTKITVVCDNPTDPDVFEAGYPAQLASPGRSPAYRACNRRRSGPRRTAALCGRAASST